MNIIKPNILTALWFFLFCIAPANATQTHEFTVDEKGFHHSEVTKRIYIGDTLKFTNTGTKQHQIVSKSGLFLDSGLLNPGVSFEYTIKSQGSYVRSGHNFLFFHDTEMPEHEFNPGFSNERVILFPRDSWFLKQYPVNILILFGTPLPLYSHPDIAHSEIQNIKLIVDGSQIFSGSLLDFFELEYTSVEEPQGLSGGQGYYASIITIDPNTLSTGSHTLTVSVTLTGDGIVYDDTVRYTILEPNFP